MLKFYTDLAENMAHIAYWPTHVCQKIFGTCTFFLYLNTVMSLVVNTKAQSH